MQITLGQQYNVEEAKIGSSSIPKFFGSTISGDPCHVLNLRRAGERAGLYLLEDMVDSLVLFFSFCSDFFSFHLGEELVTTILYNTNVEVSNESMRGIHFPCSADHEQDCQPYSTRLILLLPYV